jgi:hypothetical protein
LEKSEIPGARHGEDAAVGSTRLALAQYQPGTRRMQTFATVAIARHQAYLDLLADAKVRAGIEVWPDT